MELIELLKGAKQHLAKNAKEGHNADKSLYICNAALRYMRSKQLHIDCTEPVEQNKVTAYIAYKLKKLAKKIPCDYCAVFRHHEAAYILGLDKDAHISADLKQAARHKWLDSLIAELEAEQANS